MSKSNKPWLLMALALATLLPSNAHSAPTDELSSANIIWFDTPTSSTEGVRAWEINDFSATVTNPDQIWEQRSIPIGNGSFGGNILGSISKERIVLNEKTLWMGGPGTGAEQYWDMNKRVPDGVIDSIRTSLKAGDNKTAHQMTGKYFSGKINYDRNRFGTFTMMGEAYIETGINDNDVTNYKRILNIDKSLATVEFNVGKATYTRNYFSSYPDNVMVWNFASKGKAQNLTFSFASPHKIGAIEEIGNGLLFKGKLDNNSMEWALRIAVRVNGKGKISVDTGKGTITISGADNIDFILSGDTDYAMNFNPDMSDPKAFVGENPSANVCRWVDEALSRSYQDLYARHFDDYNSLYGRTVLSINPDSTTSVSALPTPQRLEAYRAGEHDYKLEETYFQFGRYLLISSSRPGNMPANLQGLWHNNLDGPWRVDYHNNINLQMNYWPATSTNLLECFEPLIDYVRGLVVPGQRTADAYYNARGWTAPISTNIFGFTAPLNSSDMSWNYNPQAGPWLATQLWEYYDYTRDNEWLDSIGYDIIKQSADFATDLLYDNDGILTTSPSYSPEHGTADMGTTYANSVAREILEAAIKAATILQRDSTSVVEWESVLSRIYPYQIGRYGQLQEWYEDIDPLNDPHRHTNHLFGLHPGTSINPLTDKALADACKETLRQRGDAATGWSMGWKLNHWARLHDGDHAYLLFKNLLKEGTADNMWDMHPPFQIDGNFGGTAGIAEMLLQSHNGLIHLLPALPSEWTDGKVDGLRTRGNREASIEWHNGDLTKATIKANTDDNLKILYKDKTLTIPTKKGKTYTITYDKDTARLTVK